MRNRARAEKTFPPAPRVSLGKDTLPVSLTEEQMTLLARAYAQAMGKDWDSDDVPQTGSVLRAPRLRAALLVERSALPDVLARAGELSVWLHVSQEEIVPAQRVDPAARKEEWERDYRSFVRDLRASGASGAVARSRGKAMADRADRVRHERDGWLPSGAVLVLIDPRSIGDASLLLRESGVVGTLSWAEGVGSNSGLHLRGRYPRSGVAFEGSLPGAVSIREEELAESLRGKAERSAARREREERLARIRGRAEG